MSDVAVFLVKNGIGFGHIRRALLVAAGIAEAGQLQPVVVSQAGSLALHQLRHPKVSMVNFPLLHRVPSAVTEDCYTNLLDALLRHLDPMVVVEDTYPDPRYSSLVALRDVPRLLVLRRLDGLSFDRIRARGSFARYERILVAQHSAAFTREGHSGDSLAAVYHSGRFTFVGDVAATPTPAEVAAVQLRYAPDGQRLVVVAAGAGGDQVPDGYADRLFTSCRQVADRLEGDHPDVRLVLVTGPYYAGRTIPPGPNVVVRSFEPNLAALLVAAHVAVIKPGNNSLGEVLQGSARLILVPDVSFMEGVDQHAARVIANYGGAVTQPESNQLDLLIRHALDQPPRRKWLDPASTGVTRVVDAIHDHAGRSRHLASVTSKQLVLVLQAPDNLSAAELRAVLPEPLRAFAAILERSAQPDGPSLLPLSILVASPSRTSTADGVLIDIEPPAGLAPADLANRGCTLLLTRGGTHQDAVARWLRLRPPAPSLLTADLATFQAAPGNSHRLTRRVSTLLDRQPRAEVLVDLTAIDLDAGLVVYLHELANWIRSQPIRLAALNHLRQSLARSLLEPS